VLIEYDPSSLKWKRGRPLIAAQLNEQTAAFAASTTENAELLERISHLESDAVANSRGIFRGKIMRLAKNAFSCFRHRDEDLEDGYQYKPTI
jgi:hypothetical protein